jgi:hypothetical protein
LNWTLVSFSVCFRVKDLVLKREGMAAPVNALEQSAILEKIIMVDDEEIDLF